MSQVPNDEFPNEAWTRQSKYLQSIEASAHHAQVALNAQASAQVYGNDAIKEMAKALRDGLESNAQALLQIAIAIRDKRI